MTSASRRRRLAFHWVVFLSLLESNVANAFSSHPYITVLAARSKLHDGQQQQQQQLRRFQTSSIETLEGILSDDDVLTLTEKKPTTIPTTMFVGSTLEEISLTETTQLSLPTTQDELSSSPGQSQSSADEYRRGLLTIGFITLLFSSNSPALHAAFSDPTVSPPPVLLLNAAVSVIALIALSLGGPILEAATPLPSSLVQNQNGQHDNSQEQIVAGLELGLWKFLGTTANLYGLSLTTASHGAFLIQLTTLIVPIVQGIMGVPIPRRVQGSVVLALAGVFLFTQQTIGDGLIAADMALGDTLCVVAAGFYATYDLRLFQWGKRVKPVTLVTNKIAAQALFSILLLLAVGQDESIQFLTNSEWWSNSLLIMVVVWSGIAINAVAPVLQVFGQQVIGPTRAQTLYASQPLWASILSFAFLGETMGIQGIIGGSAFLAALFLAATAEAPDPNCGKENCEV